MNLINKNNGKDYYIYDITYDNAGYPHFLVHKDGQWLSMSAKHFRPYNGEDLMKQMQELKQNWLHDTI